MKKNGLIIMFFFLFTSFMPLYSQWARTYGGSGDDYALFIQQTSDGGYIIAGNTSSFGAGGFDIWVLKLSSTGTIDWQRTYGGSSSDYALSIQQTNDGGYIVAGYTSSFGAGGNDAWVLKLSSTGTIDWQRTYGGSYHDRAYSIQQTKDGGYIVAGGTNSFGAGDEDSWVLKLSSTGTIDWQRTYGGSYWDRANSIQQTNDGGYIIAGLTESFGAGGLDMWILKLSSTGTIDWQRTYGGSYHDCAYSIQQTSDGGYIVAGYNSSFVAGNSDFWVLKLSSTGTIDWQRIYRGSYREMARCIQQTSDGGYIIAGGTESFGAGRYDAWVLKLSSTGTIDWQRTYGGSGNDYAYSIQQTSDGGYIVTGSTYSFGAGDEDIWVLKLYSDGKTDQSCGFIGSSDALIISTNFNPEDTNITPAYTYVTPLVTNVSPQDTNASVIQLCQKYNLTISASAGGTTDPSPGDYTYDSGIQVSITATPDSGYRFSKWTGDVPSGQENDNPITVIIDSDKSITANFIRQYTLTIASSAGGTTNPSPGTYTHDSGAKVSVQAVPSSGYQFSGWSGGASGTTNPITITMDSNKSITANFNLIKEKKKGPCFVASAAYGSPLHPHVETLRDFRDKYLMPNKVGRAIVDFYYKYSPFFAHLIAKNKALKIIVRINLFPLVAFSYSMVHFGPILTAVMLVFIFALPIFLIFFRKKLRRVEDRDPKALASRRLKGRRI
jgi:uncharacterized delta-60 repeat protein/uncharacterized repeat protein (TIGR02543 family)